jgi:glycosyltransferase involved in cell wall biosynthesis
MHPEWRANDRRAENVDVVIPLRNGAATILATLATVIAQTLQPRRIIVVDDGSSDGGGALARAHPMVDVITTPPVGVSHARNTGVAASQADFVAFLDCDDLWRPDKLEQQMRIVRGRPDVSVVTCDHICVLASGETIPATLGTPRFRGRVFNEILDRGFDIGGWSSSMLVRRSSFRQSGGFDEQLQFGEDMDLCIRLARDHIFDCCPELLTFVVENPASTMRRPSDDHRNLEISIQYLTAIEKWIGVAEISPQLPGRCLQFILSRYARRRLGCTRLIKFRAEMESRTPKLASLVASSDFHFLINLALCSISRHRRILAAGRRYVYRSLALRRTAVATGVRAGRRPDSRPAISRRLQGELPTVDHSTNV